MPRYTVTIHETVVYECEIDAESVISALDQAKENIEFLYELEGLREVDTMGMKAVAARLEGTHKQEGETE